MSDTRKREDSEERLRVVATLLIAVAVVAVSLPVAVGIFCGFGLSFVLNRQQSVIEKVAQSLVVFLITYFFTFHLVNFIEVTWIVDLRDFMQGDSSKSDEIDFISIHSRPDKFDDSLSKFFGYFPKITLFITVLVGIFGARISKLDKAQENCGKAYSFLSILFKPVRIVIGFFLGAIGSFKYEKAMLILFTFFLLYASAFLWAIHSEQVVYGVFGSFTLLSDFVIASFISISLAFDILPLFFDNGLNNAKVLLGNIKKEESAIAVGYTVLKNKKLLLTDRDLNHHLHVLGQPGSGKSVFLRSIYGHKILDGSGLMMIDLKADLDVLSEIIGTANEAERLDDLYIIDLSDPGKSAGYNPLERGNATELKDKVMNCLEWSEVFYKKVSERFLLGVLRGLVLLRDRKDININLKDLLKMISDPKELKILSRIVSLDSYEISENLLNLAKDLEKRETFNSLTGLRTDLEVMINSEFGSILIEKPSINLLDIAIKKKILYVLLDGQTYGESAVRLARMLISDLRAVWNSPRKVDTFLSS